MPWCTLQCTCCKGDNSFVALSDVNGIVLQFNNDNNVMKHYHSQLVWKADTAAASPPVTYQTTFSAMGAASCKTGLESDRAGRPVWPAGIG